MVARRPAPRREAGFTYVGVIVLVTIIGLVGAATLKADALLRRAAAEEELLEIGAAFSEALTSYAEATPRGQPPQPPTLAELLKDPRFPGTRRHLRKIFVDPITGKAEWGIVWQNKGTKVDGSGSGVLAVYSLSQSKPLKQANFDTRFQGLEHREHIAEWKFAAGGRGVAQGQVQIQPGQPGQIQLQLRPGQPVVPTQPGQPPAAPAESPSLFPGRGNPGTVQPSPAEPPQQQPPPPPPPQEAAPTPASPADAEPEEPAEPPPSSEATRSGDEKEDGEEGKGPRKERRR